jgi:hypothetical protein
VSPSTLHRVRRKEHDDDDGGVEQCHIWMMEAGSRNSRRTWRNSGNPAYAGWIKDRATVIAKRAKAAEMSVERR